MAESRRKPEEELAPLSRGCPRPGGLPERCAWCSAPLRRIEVHGHAQCAACGINVDPCCGGAPS